MKKIFRFFVIVVFAFTFVGILSPVQTHASGWYYGSTGTCGRTGYPTRYVKNIYTSTDKSRRDYTQYAKIDSDISGQDQTSIKKYGTAYADGDVKRTFRATFSEY